MEKYIWEFGSFVFAYLGAVHLAFTFFTNKFSSKNENVIIEMKSSSPMLTKDTTMWKAWIGFNASHSSGAIFIGLINIYLAHNYFEIFDSFLFCFNILTVGFYLWLAKNYWFKAPFLGILLTFICYLAVFTMSYLRI